MNNKFTTNEKDALIIHGLFALLCIVILILPINIGAGVKLFILVIVYNIVMAGYGILKKDNEWFGIWLFSLILSLFQVFPDWIIADILKAIVFPEDGLFKIGSVSGYMAGLWAIPIFLIIFISEKIRTRISRPAAYMTSGIIAFLIFFMSEQTVWLIPSWYAVNVKMIGFSAFYILVPEIILGLAAYRCYEEIRGRSHWIKVPAAFIVMLLYTGSVVFFYFLVERIF
jgi:hypothetical protein